MGKTREWFPAGAVPVGRFRLTRELMSALADPSKRLDNLLRHTQNVYDDCLLLGRRLIERGKPGDEEMGRELIANGRIHDTSKFSGIEWEYLNDGAWPRPEFDRDREMFLVALKQHQTTNPHHPEHWRGIEHVPPIYLAEMVCDWHARSSEQGTDMWEWVREGAPDRFKYSTKSRVYRDIKVFVELLLERKFT